jgi:hypothetical protein
MPTIIVDCEAKLIEEFVHLTAQSDNFWVLSKPELSEVEDPLDFAACILNQAATEIVDANIQRRYTIDFHEETAIDPETGLPFDYWVVDDVAIEPLAKDAARDGFEGLPGWATWTAAEAATWIETNVTDLASAKTALIAMAQAIVHLRDWR